MGDSSSVNGYMNSQLLSQQGWYFNNGDMICGIFYKYPTVSSNVIIQVHLNKYTGMLKMVM